MTWKNIAIVFIILFVLETGMIVWGIITVRAEEKNINECYYNICNNYEEAYYDDGVCHCYEYDVLGNLVKSKTEWMGW